jgi:hypothetical protein
MNFKGHLETAWHATLANIAPLIIITLVMTGISIVTLGILAPVMMAGFTQAIILMLRENRGPSVGDLFSEMRLFLPLFGFYILVVIATMIGFMLLFLPGLIVILGVSFACLYMLPLMTDRRLGLIDAIKESWAMATRGDIIDHVAVVIIYMGITAVGSSVFIGTLFTLPFATVFLMSVYQEKIGAAQPPQPPA